MMVSENETVTDVIAEMRTYVESWWSETPWGDAIEKYADRVEAAHNRELGATCEKSSQVGNNAKMREALLAIRDLARKTKSRSENINVVLTTIFWYAHGALVEIEEGGAK